MGENKKIRTLSRLAELQSRTILNSPPSLANCFQQCVELRSTRKMAWEENRTARVFFSESDQERNKLNVLERCIIIRGGYFDWAKPPCHQWRLPLFFLLPPGCHLFDVVLGAGVAMPTEKPRDGAKYVQHHDKNGDRGGKKQLQVKMSTSGQKTTIGRDFGEHWTILCARNQRFVELKMAKKIEGGIWSDGSDIVRCLCTVFLLSTCGKTDTHDCPRHLWGQRGTRCIPLDQRMRWKGPENSDEGNENTKEEKISVY